MYTFMIELSIPFADALTKVGEALKAENFTIVSDIDMQAILRGKLGLRVPAYRVLGACAAPLGKRVLEADPNGGALLPCNVVVREAGEGKTLVVFMDPRAVLGLADNEALSAVAEEAYALLQAVARHLQGDA